MPVPNVGAGGLSWASPFPGSKVVWGNISSSQGIAPRREGSVSIPVTGPAGAVGITGAQGPTGPTGHTGPNGPVKVGSQGPSGITGPVGPGGANGSVGPTGPTGSQGPIGPTGPKGHRGPIGFTGPTGTQGPEGPTGPKDSIIQNHLGIYRMAVVEGARPWYVDIGDDDPCFMAAIVEPVRFRSECGKPILFGVQCLFPEFDMPAKTPEQMQKANSFWRTPFT